MSTATSARSNKTLADEDILELLRDAFCYANPEMSDKRSTVGLESTIEALGIQSVAALEMAGFIEERLDIQFDDDEFSGINGMPDLVRLIRRHVSGR